MGYQGGIARILAVKDGAYVCTFRKWIVVFYNRHTKKIIAYNTSNSELSSNYCYNMKKTTDNKFILTGDQGITLFNSLEQTFYKVGTEGNLS